jgi:8-oxo-dGTP pyrophosphatase MutT (NUDIX family)
MNMYSIMYLVKNGLITLARKKHSIGAGKLNGYGGGIDVGENLLDSAIRELWEESGVRVEAQNVEFVATMDFYCEKVEMRTQRIPLSHCFVFIVHDWQNIPQESKEMGPPEYFPIHNLPFDRMMVGDDLWVPKILKGERFMGALLYDEDQLSVLQSEFYPKKWNL